MESTNTAVLTLSVEEAADLLGIGRDAGYNAVRTGEIPALRIGRYWRVPRAALMKMLEVPEAPMAAAE
jgi:excisionase family DNA binding protein